MVGAALNRLARACGILTNYRNANGGLVRASPESLIAGLRVLGVDLASPEHAAEELARRTAADLSSPLAQVSVAWRRDGPAVLRLRCRPDAVPEDRTAVVTLESGRERRIRLRLAPGAPLPGRRPLAMMPYELPDDLPAGYHQIALKTVSGRAEGTLIVAPERAYEPPPHIGRSGWGVFLPLHALVTGRTWGVADYTDLDAAVAWTARRGGRAFGTLPLLPAFLEAPFEPSPYAPVSRLFWNELYVDPRAVPEFADCDEARRAMAAADGEALAIRASPLLDYRRAWAIRRPVFQALVRCSDANAASRAETDRFLADNPEAALYAAYRATCDRRRAGWLSWPARLRTGAPSPRDYDRDAFRLYAYLQRWARDQLRRVGRRKSSGGAGLYLDLPIGVNREGFDVWSNQALFAAGATVGAPPDIFFSKGQDWGFPPLVPDRLGADAFRHWRAVVRHHLRFATMLRVDHVMGLHRLFVIPDGMVPGEGVYVRFPSEELYAVITLESHRARAMVVGEDLGTVPHYVGPAMRRHNIRQMYATYFQIFPGRQPPVTTPTRNMVAFINTHDMPTFKAFWDGDDTRLRRRLGVVGGRQARTEAAEKRRIKLAVTRFLRARSLLPARYAGTGGVLQAYLEYLAGSPASFLLLNVEDLWLEEAPQNVPGTTFQHPNWRHRARFSLEDWGASGAVQDALAVVRRARTRRQPVF